MNEILSFHEWKEQMIEKEGFRRSDNTWYYNIYGAYCEKIRKSKVVTNLKATEVVTLTSKAYGWCNRIF